jgi:hypothetical protein
VAFDEVRTGPGDDVDRLIPRPGQDVLDELEQRGIGPVEILEDEDDRVHGVNLP